MKWIKAICQIGTTQVVLPANLFSIRYGVYNYAVCMSWTVVMFKACFACYIWPFIFVGMLQGMEIFSCVLRKKIKCHMKGKWVVYLSCKHRCFFSNYDFDFNTGQNPDSMEWTLFIIFLWNCHFLCKDKQCLSKVI